MSQTTLIILSVVLAVVVIAVLAAALIKVRSDLDVDLRGPRQLASALSAVEAEHLQAARARGQGDQRPVRRDPQRAPGIARKAKVVAERRPT